MHAGSHPFKLRMRLGVTRANARHERHHQASRLRSRNPSTRGLARGKCVADETVFTGVAGIAAAPFVLPAQSCPSTSDQQSLTRRDDNYPDAGGIYRQLAPATRAQPRGLVGALTRGNSETIGEHFALLRLFSGADAER